MEIINKERKEEIIKRYESGDTALFNWCEEYNQFVNNSTRGCVTAEVNYILKRSVEDSEAPLNYVDLDDAKVNSITQVDIIQRGKEKDLKFGKVCGDVN